MRSKTDWKRIENMTDEDIDYSNMTKLNDEFFKNAKVVIPKKKKDKNDNN